MNSEKRVKTKEKRNGHRVLKLSPDAAGASAPEPRMGLPILGGERVERFTVPVVILHRRD